jgi:hypothetical protein
MARTTEGTHPIGEPPGWLLFGGAARGWASTVVARCYVALEGSDLDVEPDGEVGAAGDPQRDERRRVQ